MTILLSITTLTSLIALAFLFFYFDSKSKEYKRQILSLNNHIYKLKNRLPQNNITKFNLIIEYISPKPFKYGVILPFTNIYIAPLSNCPVINKVKEKMQIEILEEAEINNETWYFIDLKLTTNKNSKGWIKKSQMSMLIEDTP
ncbi:MAG: SH3 domain-containing protein, partial [Sarcina sp.]